MQPARSGRASAIIVAAGRGTRLGIAEKVLLPLAGRPLLSYSIDAAEAASSIAEIIVVAGLHTKTTIERIISESNWTKVSYVALGGERRQDSVEAGLRLVCPDVSIVAVHDAARPFATPELFNACVTAAERTGAAIAAVPVVDTLKRAHSGLIVETVPRDEMWAAQTPQAFQKALLHSSFAFAYTQGIEVTDEARLFELQGLPVAIVESSTRNLKVTQPDDLELAEAMLQILRSGHAR